MKLSNKQRLIFRSVRCVLSLGLMLLSPLASAQMGVTEWSQQMLKGPATGLAYVMNAISFLAGVGFILGSYIQYQAHRENPQQVRISTPIFLICAGIVLIILPLLSWIAEGGAFLRPRR